DGRGGRASRNRYCLAVISSVMTMRTVLLLSCLAMAACGEGGSRLGGVNRSTADVQVLNAASTSIDLFVGQTAPPGNSDIPFGTGPLCMTMEAVSHGLSVRPAGVRTTTVPL